jgi:hypothetical protein
MRGSVLLLPQYVFMAWCSVKKAQGQLYLYLLPLPLSYLTLPLYDKYTLLIGFPTFPSTKGPDIVMVCTPSQRSVHGITNKEKYIFLETRRNRKEEVLKKTLKRE